MPGALWCALWCAGSVCFGVVVLLGFVAGGFYRHSTDHLCFIMPLRFIRAGSAIVGPLSGSQRALTLAVCGQEPWHSGMES